MKAKPKAVHHVSKSNAFLAACGEDCPGRSTVKKPKVTCKRCLRVIEARAKGR